MLSTTTKSLLPSAAPLASCDAVVPSVSGRLTKKTFPALWAMSCAVRDTVCGSVSMTERSIGPTDRAVTRLGKGPSNGRDRVTAVHASDATWLQRSNCSLTGTTLVLQVCGDVLPLTGDRAS